MRDATLGIVISCLICLAPPLGLAGQPLIPLPDGACARLGLGALQCMDVSPDGRILALGTSLGIEVRDASTFELRLWIACDAVMDLAFSPDGALLACPSDAGVRLIDTTTWQVARETPLARRPWRIAFSPSGAQVACVTTPDFETFQVEIVDVASGRNVKVLRIPSHVWSVAFAPDAKTLAVGCEAGSIFLFNAQSWELTRTLEGHYGPVDSLSFSPDGQRLASGDLAGWGATALVWNAVNGKKLRTLTEEHKYGIAFSPDGKTIAEGAQNGEVRLWDAEKGTRIATLAGLRCYDGWVRGDPMLRYTPDGQRILAGSSVEGTLIAWNAMSGAPLATLTEHSRELWSLAFSPDGEELAVGTWGAIDIWDIGTKALVTRLRVASGSQVSGLAFTPDGKTLVENLNADDADPWRASGVQAWDTATWIARSLFAEDRDRTNALAVSPDGRFIVTGTGTGGTKVWDAETLQFMRCLTGLQGYVNTVAFSPDGAMLAAIDEAGAINLWSVPKWKLLRTLEGTPSNRPRDASMDPPSHKTCLAFSSDGSVLASASCGADEVRFWSPSTGRLERTLSVPAAQAITFSPDGRLLAAASSRQLVVLDVASGRVMRTIDGDSDYINCVAFSPDGRFLATAGYSGSVLLWECSSL